MANVLSAFVLMILGFVLYMRFVIFSCASGRVRMGVLIGMPLLAGIGSLLFEITAVSGLLFPTIQLRGTQLADENLEQASTQVEWEVGLPAIPGTYRASAYNQCELDGGTKRGKC